MPATVDRGASGRSAPRIVVTLSDPTRSPDSGAAAERNQRYLEAVVRAGGRAVPLDERLPAGVIAAELEAMDGLLLSGGVDLDPALYGEESAGSGPTEPGRDDLDVAAWRAAQARRSPILGICRGFQALNVLMGGRLVQHVESHSPSYPPPGQAPGRPVIHPLRIAADSLLARVLGRGDGASALMVNSYHHQAVRERDLAPGLRAVGWSDHPHGELIEAVELDHSARFVIGVQCHPERTETTPPEFERLFAAFVEAARRRT